MDRIATVAMATRAAGVVRNHGARRSIARPTVRGVGQCRQPPVAEVNFKAIATASAWRKAIAVADGRVGTGGCGQRRGCRAQSSNRQGSGCIQCIARDGRTNALQQGYGWNGTGAQRWRVEGGRTFRLVNVNGGKCLDVESGSRDAGANIQQWSCYGREEPGVDVRAHGICRARLCSARWRAGIRRSRFRPPRRQPASERWWWASVRKAARHSGMFASRATSKCADVSGATTADGGDVRQWSCHGENQMWDVVDLGRGEVALWRRTAAKVMEVTGDNRRSGADVVQNAWNGRTNQRWHFEPNLKRAFHAW